MPGSHLFAGLTGVCRPGPGAGKQGPDALASRPRRALGADCPALRHERTLEDEPTDNGVCASEARRAPAGPSQGPGSETFLTWAFVLGAGDGNRTRTISSGRCDWLCRDL